MKFYPEKCSIEDKPMEPFIDANEIWDHINSAQPTRELVNQIVQKSLNKERLTLRETATLINADDPESIKAIKEGAQELKEKKVQRFS